MRGMPSVLGGLYVELPCRFVFYYPTPYVLLKPWQCLTILASYTRYPTSPDASRISLGRSDIVQRPLDSSLTTGVYRFK